MTEFLVPNPARQQNPLNDPYTTKGAQKIVKKWNREVIEMLQAMGDLEVEHGEGYKIFLATSPLRSLIWVAAAMKTIGWIIERPSANGACALTLSDRGRRALTTLRKQEII